jgi:adenylate cyclase class IV
MFLVWQTGIINVGKIRQIIKNFKFEKIFKTTKTKIIWKIRKIVIEF